MSNRHRRTRIYGANYDIGESYYKKQLSELERKKEFPRSTDLSFDIDTRKDSKLSPKVTFLSDDLDLNDNNSNIIRKFNFNNNDDEDHIIQGRSAYKSEELDKSSNIIRKFNFNNNDDEDHIIQRRSTYKPEELDIYNTSRKSNAHDFKEESFIKQRNFSKVTHSDYDLDEDYIKSSPKTTREFSVDIDRHHKSFGRSSNRFLSSDDMGRQKSPVNLEEKTISLSKLRSKFISDKTIRNGNIEEEEDAVRRAKESKARLLDLEEQITSITNKQNEREKRNKNLKKILSEVSNQ